MKNFITSILIATNLSLVTIFINMSFETSATNQFTITKDDKLVTFDFSPSNPADDCEWRFEQREEWGRSDLIFVHKKDFLGFHDKGPKRAIEVEWVDVEIAGTGDKNANPPIPPKTRKVKRGVCYDRWKRWAEFHLWGFTYTVDEFRNIYRLYCNDEPTNYIARGRFQQGNDVQIEGKNPRWSNKVWVRQPDVDIPCDENDDGDIDNSEPTQPNTGEVDFGATEICIPISKDPNAQPGFNLTSTYDLDFIYRIITHDTPRARDLHGTVQLEYVSGDQSLADISHNNVPYTLGNKINVVEPGHVGGGVHSNHGSTISFQIKSKGREGTLVVKGICDPSREEEGDGWPTVMPELKINFVDVDISVDSNNDGNLTEDDDEIENQFPGKLILVNDFDSSGDLFPDFADGFNFDLEGEAINNSEINQSRKFSRLYVNLSLLPDDEEIYFDYHSSDPNGMYLLSNQFHTPLGSFRLWTKDGNEARNSSSIIESGDFIPSGQRIKVEDLKAALGESSEGFLYIEAVDTTNINEHRISLVAPECHLQDTVTVSAVKVSTANVSVKSGEYKDVTPINISGMLFGAGIDSESGPTFEEWWDEQIVASQVFFPKKYEPYAYILSPKDGETLSRLDQESEGTYKIDPESGKIRIVGGFIPSTTFDKSELENSIGKTRNLHTPLSSRFQYRVNIPAFASIYEHEFQHVQGKKGDINVTKPEITFTYNKEKNDQVGITEPEASGSFLGAFLDINIPQVNGHEYLETTFLNGIGNFDSVNFANDKVFSFGPSEFLAQEVGVKVFSLGLKIEGESPKDNLVQLVTVKVDPLVLIEPDINHMKYAGDESSEPELPSDPNYSFFESLVDSSQFSETSLMSRELYKKALFMLAQYIFDDPNHTVNKWHNGLDIPQENALKFELTKPAVEHIFKGFKLEDTGAPRTSILRRILNTSLNGQGSDDYKSKVAYQKGQALNYLNLACVNKLKHDFSLKFGPKHLSHTSTPSKLDGIGVDELSETSTVLDLFSGIRAYHYFDQYFKKDGANVLWSISNPITTEVLQYMLQERILLYKKVLETISTKDIETGSPISTEEEQILNVTKDSYPLRLLISPNINQLQLYGNEEHLRVSVFEENNVTKYIATLSSELLEKLEEAGFQVENPEIDVSPDALVTSSMGEVEQDQNIYRVWGTFPDGVKRVIGGVSYGFGESVKHSVALTDIKFDIETIQTMLNTLDYDDIIQRFKTTNPNLYAVFQLGDYIIPLQSTMTIYEQENLITGEPIGLVENLLTAGDLFISLVPIGSALKGKDFLLTSVRSYKKAVHNNLKNFNGASKASSLASHGSALYDEVVDLGTAILENENRGIQAGLSGLKSFTKKITFQNIVFSRLFVRNSIRNALFSIQQRHGYGTAGTDVLVMKAHAGNRLPGNLLSSRDSELVFRNGLPENQLDDAHDYISKEQRTATRTSSKYVEKLTDNVNGDYGSLPNTYTKKLDSTEAWFLKEFMEEGVSEARAYSKVLKLRESLCFKKDTKVLLANGSTKMIQDVKIGDVLFSKHESSPLNSLSKNAVTQLHRSKAMKLLKISLAVSGRGPPSYIELTPDHPMWVIGKGWIFAKDIQLGDLLSTIDAREVVVSEVSEYETEEIVYNLSINNSHTYFINVNGISIWTHNICDEGNAIREYLDDLKNVQNKNIKISDIDIKKIVKVTENAKLKIAFYKHPDFPTSGSGEKLAKNMGGKPSVAGTVDADWRTHHLLVSSLFFTDSTTKALVEGFEIAAESGTGKRWFPGIKIDMNQPLNGLHLPFTIDEELLVGIRAALSRTDRIGGVLHRGGHAAYNEGQRRVLQKIIKRIEKSTEPYDKIIEEASSDLHKLMINCLGALTAKETDLALHTKYLGGSLKDFDKGQIRDLWENIMSEGIDFGE